MDKLLRRIAQLERTVKRLETRESPIVVSLVTALTSVDWTGDAKTVADNGVIDLSAVFGAPAGIKAAHCIIYVADGTPDVGFRLGSEAGQTLFGQRTQVANIRNINAGWVPCDANGDITALFTGDIDLVSLFITAFEI